MINDSEYTLDIDLCTVRTALLNEKMANLSGEITDDISCVASPQGTQALVLDSTAETFTDSCVGFREAAGLDHLILILNQKLYAFDRGGGGFGDCCRDSAHEKIDNETGEAFLIGSLYNNRWRN